MKKLLYLLLLLPVLASAQREGAVIDEVIARVGGEYILLSDLEEQFALAQSQGSEELPANARCGMMDQLMVQKLLYNQSKLDSIEVGDGEVEQQLNARIDRILGYMNGDINQFEEYYGQSITAVKEQFREDLREQLATDRIRGQVVRGVKVTPSEVMAFFDEIPRDSLPYFNSEVEVGELAIKPEPSDSTRERTIARLEEIKMMIDSGRVTFEDAARQFSQDGSARGGGDLGWTKRGKFVPEFEAVAYNLDENQISEVTQSEFGYHLIRLDGRRGNTIKVSHILIRPPVLDSDIEQSRNYLDSIATLIRDDSVAFNIAVKRFGFDKVQSYNNDGRMSNPVSGNTFFEIGDLDPDIYFTIDDMAIGEISDPIEFRDPGGDIMLRIVQLQSRSAPHRATLKQDYSRILDATKKSKQQEYLEAWLEERVSSTFIRLDERYQACPNLKPWLEDSRQLTSNGAKRP